MPVTRVDALCTCEGCGKRFGVEIDTAEDLKEGNHADFESLVRETIRSGESGYIWGVRGKATVDRISLGYHVTIQGGLMLCDVCSKKCDDLPTDDNLTESQVLSALRIAR